MSVLARTRAQVVSSHHDCRDAKMRLELVGHLDVALELRARIVRQVDVNIRLLPVADLQAIEVPQLMIALASVAATGLRPQATATHVVDAASVAEEVDAKRHVRRAALAHATEIAAEAA